ncbi:hypothetical protein B23_1832 [Geobacillus thermoleovorans B23]|nr:hypothetical protein B23_1832 [Geobacillus thermoleovorans B23]
MFEQAPALMNDHDVERRQALFFLFHSLLLCDVHA